MILSLHICGWKLTSKRCKMYKMTMKRTPVCSSCHTLKLKAPTLRHGKKLSHVIHRWINNHLKITDENVTVELTGYLTKLSVDTLTDIASSYSALVAEICQVLPRLHCPWLVQAPYTCFHSWVDWGTLCRRTVMKWLWKWAISAKCATWQCRYIFLPKKKSYLAKRVSNPGPLGPESYALPLWHTGSTGPISIDRDMYSSKRGVDYKEYTNCVWLRD